MTASNQHVRSGFFIGLLLIVMALAVAMFRPLLITIAMSVACAVALQPLYQAFFRITRGMRGLSSFLTILTTAIVILAPLTLIAMQVAQEAASLYQNLSEGGTFLPLRILEDVETIVTSYIPNANLNLTEYAGQAAGLLAQNLGAIFAGTVGTILHIFLGIIAFYYFLKDGETFIHTIIGLSPLANRHDESIFRRLTLAINSILKGSLLIATLQGFTSGIGFAIFGVPSATLWGLLAAVGALIPGVGTASVILPAVIFLFATGEQTSAIGLAVWGVVAVGLIDNFLGPVLVGRGVRIHPMLVLFAVIGGLQFFGPLGFILGPLLLSLLYALLDIYRSLYVRHPTPPNIRQPG